MKVNNEGFLEKKTSARNGDNNPTYRNWWIVKQHSGRPGGIVELGKLSLPKRFIGKKIMIKVVEKIYRERDIKKKEIQKMVWKKLEEGSYQNENPKKYDFSITKEGKKYLLDIFDAKIENSNEAYIETIRYNTLREAKEEAKDYEEAN